MTTIELLSGSKNLKISQIDLEEQDCSMISKFKISKIWEEKLYVNFSRMIIQFKRIQRSNLQNKRPILTTLPSKKTFEKG